MENESKSLMLAKVTESLLAASWLTESDMAAGHLAQVIAAELDVAIGRDDADKIIALSPRLLDVLKQLHLTPETRTQGKQQDEADGSGHLGNYLRLLDSTATHAKSESAKRRSSSK